MLTASLISAVIGTKLPGPGCIYMSQTIRWSAPVRAGDTVVARVTITDINREKERVLMDTTCSVGEDVVLEGECLAKVPARADRTR
jgi:3-hydroxybutyryl-CoA dehydratase